MKTGTDISLRVCREEGYAIVTHYGKKLKPEKEYRVEIYNPHGKKKSYFLDTEISYKNLWEQFQEKGKRIKEYCDFENCPFPSPKEDPSFMDMAHLAQTLYYYCGVE